MYFNNTVLSGLFKAGAAATGLVGILLQCGMGSGTWNLAVLNYFTLMSNILCVVYFAAGAFYQLRGKSIPFWRLKGPVLLYILITGVVYHFMLHGHFAMEAADLVKEGSTLVMSQLSNTLLHYVMPALTLLDWLLFDEKGRYPARDPFLWLLFPLFYAVYVNIRVATGAVLGLYDGSRYPYFFMDADLLGWGNVLLIMMGMAVGFALLGHLLRGLDNLLAKIPRIPDKA